jgi:N-acyl-D-amino-acid deacylase
MIGSDGLPHDAIAASAAVGHFPGVLGTNSRELKLFPLEIAVYKMRGLPAAKFGLEGRGAIKVGAHADITIFDADKIAIAPISSTRPSRPQASARSSSIGEIVWRDGRATGKVRGGYYNAIDDWCRLPS